MDFNKPYEPSTSAQPTTANTSDNSPRGKRAPQAVPALFKKKAA